eukprot:scaffold102200_cov63-Attheya_sp.AAC.1
MVSTWVPLVQIETASIGEVHGRIMIPRMVVLCFGRIGLGYGGVGLIRQYVVRLVGVGEATNQHQSPRTEHCIASGSVPIPSKRQSGCAMNLVSTLSSPNGL